MKILVTGSSGRVGRAIYVRLARGHEVIGFDRSPASTTSVVGDLTDATLLRAALRGVDAVVHTAAVHAPHVGLVSDAEFKRINVLGTQMLAEIAVELSVQNFVFTSTTAVYGAAATPALEAGWVDEMLPPQPRTIYHTTKLDAESLLESFASETGLAVTVLRMSRCFPEPAPAMAVYRLHRGVDVRDVADAHALALFRGQPGFRMFIVSGEVPFCREDAEELLCDAPAVLQRRAPSLVRDFRERGWELPASIDRVYTPHLAARELGWSPRFGYSEIIRMLEAQSSEVLPPRTGWNAEKLKAE